MADKSHIEWTDATWNVITGCSVLSPGCKHCYAMKLAGGRMRNDPTRAGLTVDSEAGPVWNGEVRWNEKWATLPLQWARPRMIFVCAHADLFHDAVPDVWIDHVFGVMAAASQHTYQVLTKRSERMRAYLSAPADDLFDRWMEAAPAWAKPASISLPLPHVWLGVSVEDQLRAQERVADLVETRAAVRWVSAEPLLAQTSLRPWLHALQWVVVGGESGPRSRPMHPAWARALRDECQAAGTAFLFKQWGDWAPLGAPGRSVEIGRNVFATSSDRVHRFDDRATVVYYGKRTAGRLLDGRVHDGYPVAHAG